jgi:hypothetical protein
MLGRQEATPKPAFSMEQLDLDVSVDILEEDGRIVVPGP